MDPVIHLNKEAEISEAGSLSSSVLLTCDVGMELQESLQRDVGRKSLYAVVWHAVLRPTLRTLDLPLDVVHQALHAGLEAVVVLAGQHLGCPVPVQADTAGEQLVELLHPAAAAAELPQLEVLRVSLGVFLKISFVRPQHNINNVRKGNCKVPIGCQD